MEEGVSVLIKNGLKLPISFYGLWPNSIFEPQAEKQKKKNFDAHHSGAKIENKDLLKLQRAIISPLGDQFRPVSLQRVHNLH